MTSRDERDALSRFRERYSIPPAEVAADIEQRVIGAAWGANGYTTVAQANELGRRLDLGPGRTLLDVGTGRGWPSLYLATQSGCALVGTDMPLDALVVAARRARADGRMPSVRHALVWTPGRLGGTGSPSLSGRADPGGSRRRSPVVDRSAMKAGRPIL